MKLLRFGLVGEERPGILDAQGNIRDLSIHVQDISDDALSNQNIERIGRIDLATLPVVEGNPRLGSCVTGTGKFICIGP